jgi:hypothetical protein
MCKTRPALHVSLHTLSICRMSECILIYWEHVHIHENEGYVGPRIELSARGGPVLCVMVRGWWWGPSTSLLAVLLIRLG